MPTQLVYLDATAPDAGATRLCPGSHRNGGGLHGGLYSDRTAEGGPGRIKEEAVLAHGGWIEPEMKIGARCPSPLTILPLRRYSLVVVVVVCPCPSRFPSQLLF